MVVQSPPSVSKPKARKKLLVAVVIAGVVIVGIVATWWFLQWDFGYTRIKVAKGNKVTHDFDGIEYNFYLGSERRLEFGTGTGSSYSYYISAPSPGNRYEVLGLEVIIVEIYDDYAILRVKPL